MSDKELTALLARARQGANPTDRDRRVVRAALRGRLGVGAAVGVGAAATKATAGVASKGIAALPALAVVKVAAPVVVAVVGIAAVGAALKQPAGAPAAQSGAPRTVASSLVVAPQTVAPSTVASAATVSDPPLVPSAAAPPLRTTAAPGSGHKPAPAPTNTGDPLAPERDAADDLALVRQMQVALRDGDTRHVLALVQEHERRFPASGLAPERDGARVLAQCIEADPGKAEVLGQRFLERYPLSPLAAHVRATCMPGAKGQ